MIDCYFGDINEHGDCVRVEGDEIEGLPFCEVHSDILSEYDAEERDHVLTMLRDTHLRESPRN